MSVLALKGGRHFFLPVKRRLLVEKGRIVLHFRLRFILYWKQVKFFSISEKAMNFSGTLENQDLINFNCI